MKIDLVTGAYYPSNKHGGPVVTNHCLAKALINLGHDVSVVTTDMDGESRLKLDDYDTIWDGVPVRYCRCNRVPLPYYSFELYRVLQNRPRPDIALISSAWAMYGLTAGRYYKDTDIPYVMYGHGSFDPIRMKKSMYKKKLFWFIFDHKLYNNAAAVVALTDNEKQQMVKLGINKEIEVVPNGVELGWDAKHCNDSDSFNCSEFVKDNKYILFLGRIESIKGLDILVEAYARSNSYVKDSALVIAGPDEKNYKKTIIDLISKNKIEDKVIFTGPVIGKSKIELLANAELFVLTSYGEGLPMAVLEAMSCGTPVLATYQCNIPKVEECRAGVLVEPTVEAVKNGLEQVLADINLRHEMGENGKKVCLEFFSWDSVAKQTEKFCERILGIYNG